MYPFDITRDEVSIKQEIFNRIEKRIDQIELRVSRIQKHVKKHISVMDQDDIIKAQQIVDQLDTETKLLKNLFDFYVNENELIY